MTTDIPEDGLATEVLWGTENAKLLTTRKKLEFLNAIKEGRFEEIREELADAMADEAMRIGREMKSQKRLITVVEGLLAEEAKKPFLRRLFARAFK